MDKEEIDKIIARSTGLEDYLAKSEELHPDLQEYLDNTANIGACLRHPLVYGIPYMARLNASGQRRVIKLLYLK